MLKLPKKWPVLLSPVWDETRLRFPCLSIELGWTVARWIPWCREFAREYKSEHPAGKVIAGGLACEEPLWTDFVDRYFAVPDAGRRLLSGPEAMALANTKDVAFRRYGMADALLQRVVLHCRGVQRKHSQNYMKWDEVISFFDSTQIAIVGSPSDQIPTGTSMLDWRGMQMGKLCDVLASAHVVVGCSSGVMHLASICGAPIVAWGDNRTYTGKTLRERYETLWNPFGAHVEWIDCETTSDAWQEKWHPSPDEIKGAIENVLGRSDQRGGLKRAIHGDDNADGGRDVETPTDSARLPDGGHRAESETPARQSGKRTVQRSSSEQLPEAGMDLNGKRVVLHSKLLLGDTLMLTCLVRDLKATFPRVRIRLEIKPEYEAIFENSPYIEDFDGYDYRVEVGPVAVLQGSKTSGLHITRGFPVSWEKKTGIPLRQGALRGDLHLDDDSEKEVYINKQYTDETIFQKHYWVIAPDCGPYDSKRWISERWQQVIDAMPEIRWIQIGDKNPQIILTGNNVTNLVGKTGIDDLIRVIYHSRGLIGLVSGPMHIAAALKKPAVIIAGAREPATYESYQFHRYLNTTGALPCCQDTACWAARLNSDGETCKRTEGRRINGVPECIAMIEVEDVVRAVRSYEYAAGRRSQHRPAERVVSTGPTPEIAVVSAPASQATAPAPKLLRIVSNGKMLGGAERSVCEIARMALADGWRVELATRGNVLCKAMENALPDGVERARDIGGFCDVLLLYASDMVFDFHKPEFDPFKNLQAKRKVMALTYTLGNIAKAEWTFGWHKYLFLSSTMRHVFLNFLSSSNDTIDDPDKTQVLAPPVDLEPFFSIKRPYKSRPITLVRHSSQGDKKYSENIPEIVAACPDKKFMFMPGPSFLNGASNVITFKENELPVAEFLKHGNCYWYLLPDGYTDQGPRAIMEAMAAGFPVIAENRDGAKDRVTKECGWLVDSHDEALRVVHDLDAETLEQKGNAARERARTEFVKEKWLDAIIG